MCKRLIYLTSFILVMVAVPLVTHAQVDNLVLNSSFEEDEVILDDPFWYQWCTWNPSQGAGSNATIVKTESIDGKRSLRVEPKGAENWYFIVEYISFPLKVGTPYTVTFWAKAEAPRPLAAWMKAADNSFGWGWTNFQLTTEWAEYSYTTVALNAQGKLEIFCAGVEVPFWLDFVFVYETETTPSARQDVTSPGDTVQGVPNDGDRPSFEHPALAIDDDLLTKYLHFKGDFVPDPGTGGAGFQVTPSVGPTVVTGLTLTTANDVPGRDPIAFELSGSNDSIDGPYTLIASGNIVDFAQDEEWPRYTKNETPITFENYTAYSHYQIIFTAIRGPVGAPVVCMQIAEVELLERTPEEMLDELYTQILTEVSLGSIDVELERPLLAKVDATSAALSRGNKNDAKVAMNDLKALINQVEAQIDKKITPDAAAEIIQQVNAIIEALSG